MINIDSLYAVFTPLAGLSSAILAGISFIEPQIPTNMATGTDLSPMAVIVSLIATFLLGLMRITNSIKNVEDTNGKILITQTALLESNNKLLETNNKLLQLFSDDSKRQDELLLNQKKLLDIENKNMDLTSKMSNTMNRIANNGTNSAKKEIKKSGNSGTNYPINR